MNDLDGNKADLLEAAKALQAAVTEISQYNVKQLDASEAQRAQLHQFMREQDALIQEMKYHFNREVMQLRQDFCRQSSPHAGSCAPSNPHSAPPDLPSSQDE